MANTASLKQRFYEFAAKRQAEQKGREAERKAQTSVPEIDTLRAAMTTERARQLVETAAYLYWLDSCPGVDEVDLRLALERLGIMEGN